MSGVEAGFWNNVDQPNYFRGSLGIGSGSRQVGATVGAELHLVEPDGGEMVLARYDASIGTNNSLGKILFGSTEDSGSTVNFSASIQAFAQSAHSTTDADGYLSFYTTPQSSTTLEEQLRITRSGTIKVIRGDIEMPAGQGISFINAADTASGETVASSVLDDYEEGSFLPLLYAGSTSVTVSNNVGRYTKIGNVVIIRGSMTRNDSASKTGNLNIRGLPFGIQDVAYLVTMGMGHMWIDNGTNLDRLGLTYMNSNTQIYGVVDKDVRTGRYIQMTSLTNGRPVYFSVMYHTAT
jgi:hypothetical protein